MITFAEYKKKALKDPKVKEMYDELQPDYAIIQALIDAKNNHHITQKELSAITGINQAYITRLEKGLANPSLTTLKKLAKGLNLRLKIKFVNKK